MKRKIDSKYEIVVRDRTRGDEDLDVIIIQNIYNGNTIPIDEPTFIFRAKDCLSTKVLLAYYKFCTIDNCTVEQLSSLESMINEFKTWQKNNPDKMKQPGSTMPADIKKQKEGY